MRKLPSFAMMKRIERIGYSSRTMGRRCEKQPNRSYRDNVADVDDDWNSVNRIAQTESNKLAKLPQLIESKVGRMRP
jgi:hypothetical protein